MGEKNGKYILFYNIDLTFRFSLGELFKITQVHILQIRLYLPGLQIHQRYQESALEKVYRSSVSKAQVNINL